MRTLKTSAAAVLSAAVMMTSAPAAANGEYVTCGSSSGSVSYTYNELAAMTDGEVRALFPDYFAGGCDGRMYDPAPFGDETMSDYDKFRQFYGDFEWGGYDFIDMDGLSGKRSYYITYFVDDRYDLVDGLTAVDFGFPDDWTLRIDRGYFTRHYDGSGWYYRYSNEYRLTVPAETAEDFESFIRLELCSKSCPDEHVISVHSTESFYTTVLYEPAPEYPLGDVNYDFTVDMSDVVRIMRSYADPADHGLISVFERRLADVDGVGGVTNSDALWLQRTDAGLIDISELIPSLDTLWQ